jgi:hypothetical protein
MGKGKQNDHPFKLISLSLSLATDDGKMITARVHAPLERWPNISNREEAYKSKVGRFKFWLRNVLNESVFTRNLSC